MFKTMRELWSAVREAMGTRNTVLLVVLFVLASPCILLCAIVVVLVGFPLDLVGRAYTWLDHKIRGVGRRIDDPVFGPLEYQGSTCWYTERPLAIFGGQFTVCLTAPRESGPGPLQYELFRALLARQDDIRTQVQESIYLEYQARVPQLREEAGSFGALKFSEVPLLDEAAEIWSLLTDGSLNLEDQDQPGNFFLSWECSWDPEHGVSRMFLDWQLVDDD